MFRTACFRVLLMMCCVTCLLGVARAQGHAIEPNGAGRPAGANDQYRQLRAALPTGEGIKVSDLTLERQGATFHFDTGAFYFYRPVNGMVTGAVFEGKGHFALSPKDASEASSLARLVKGGVMAQDFSTLVLRFTDGTAEELRKASAGSAGMTPGAAASVGVEFGHSFRADLHENLDMRLLADVLEGSADQKPGQFFLASFKMGMLIGRKVLFVVDPEGTFHAAPDEVELSTLDGDNGLETWTAYRMTGRHASHERSRGHITAQKLDVSFTQSGALKGSAETTITIAQDGVRLLPMNLYPTLRVTGVYAETGTPIDFIQEPKEADADFAIVLPQPAKRGETLHLLARYAGPDAVRRDGDGVYYLLPGARESWYPSSSGGFGEYASFAMTFHLPKRLQIIATGRQVSVAPEEGGGTKAVWVTDQPIEVAGFNLGDFKSADTKTPQGFAVAAYANVELPDYALPFANHGAGTMSTVPMLKNEVAQGSAAIQVYSDYFGKLPYDHVALTQQSACNFGQSWPMLVYLPTCAFWDSTVQQQLGLLEYDRSYWTEVTPHEVSHQWWGQLVGFNSYRDQWMSEGFANFSVGLYLLATEPKMTGYRDFWLEQKNNLLKKNDKGLRPVDVGPLTMGGRVANEKTGNVYQELIYSKGAYVLHMLEMLYWTPAKKEEPFKHSMQAFVAEYSGKAATTEDFKHSLEKTMPAWVNLAHDGKLDWFFNEYVYGTELPHYVVAGDFVVSPEGETSVHIRLAQSQVSKTFVMSVPLYMEMANGATVRLATVPLHGEESFDRTVKLGKLPAAAKRLLVNYNADVLSD